MKKKYAHPIHISKGNTKLGNIPNLSLTPVRSCSACACKTCALEGCYALDSYKAYPETRTAWDANTTLAVFYLGEMEAQLNDYFGTLTAPRFFRIHVGGDFITKEYAEMWYRVAKRFPHTMFLAFTKQFDVIRGIPFNTLPNFAMRLSDWPGTEIPADLAELYPIAYMDDGTRDPNFFPADVFKCPGNCETCGHCWLSCVPTVFLKHGTQGVKGRKMLNPAAGFVSKLVKKYAISRESAWQVLLDNLGIRKGAGQFISLPEEIMMERIIRAA